MNIAIVTGASSGMGREFVRQLSDYVQVDAIWAVARRAEALETLWGLRGEEARGWWQARHDELTKLFRGE